MTPTRVEILPQKHLHFQTPALQQAIMDNLDISHENIIFGCDFDNRKLPGTTSGIVGLSNHKSSLVGQFGFSQFSYCVPANINFHGQMRFGSEAIIRGPTTELAANEEGFYYFQNVDGLYFDGEKVEEIPDDVFKFVEGGPAGCLLMDTGTTYTDFRAAAFNPLMKKVKEKMQDIEPKPDETKTFELCYDIKYFQIGNLPVIEIKFTDTTDSLKLIDTNSWIVMPPASPGDPPTYFCLAMDGDSDDISMLGMYQMKDLNVGIDLERLQLSFIYYPNCPDYQ
ncbi:hypothetical protein Q3G72_033540 [Acer saccharum]|nr:hypothetical protein Q3G72_033540 [Acer saccharum]